MELVQKWPIFQLFFVSSIDQENVFYDTLKRKNAFLVYKNKNFKKSKTWHFSKGVDRWFWSKNGHFSDFFLAYICQENVFYDILERKNAFLGQKKRRSKSLKIDIFPKGITYAFGPKMAIFPTFFFLRQYKPGTYLLRYSRTKKRLSRPENQHVQKV